MTLQSVHVGGGSYRNLAETDRRLMATLVKNRYGAVSGFVPAPGAGLTLAIPAGEAFVRGKSVTGQGFYYVSDIAAASVNWPAPAASARIDALVLAVGDPAYGAVGSGLGATPGPQWIVVQGTPGSGTPPTDATIQAAVGAGGWERWANVTINSTDTTIAPGNIASQLSGMPQAGVWGPYTPLWTAFGTPPVLGNGTLNGFFKQDGKDVDFRIEFTYGSTSTQGTSGWMMSLPVTPRSTFRQRHHLSVLQGSNAWGGWGEYYSGANALILVVPNSTAGAVDRAIGNGPTPGAWAAGHQIVIGGRYEAA